MISEDKIKEIYEEVIEKNKQDIEREKKDAIKERIFNWIMFPIVLFGEIKLYSLIINLKNSCNIEITAKTFIFILPIVLLALGTPIALLLNRKKKLNIYINNFKDRIEKEIIKLYSKDVAFLKNEQRCQDKNEKQSKYEELVTEYKKTAGFGEWRYNNYEVQELIQGNINNTSKFSIMQINQILDGYSNFAIYAKIETSNNFDTVYLEKNETNKEVLKKDLYHRLRLEIDSSDIRLYEKYSEYENTGMRLITNDIREAMVNFAKELKIKYMITIKDNCIYIKFDTYKILENSLGVRYPIEHNGLYLYCKILEFTIDITNKLVEASKNIKKEI